jgi:predicted permease
VAVIGYDLWQLILHGDPSVIGRRILVDGSDHTIVGVMPPGFAFPENQWLWTALRASPTRHARGEGPALFVFGRLAPGATREQARAELAGIGARSAAAFPETNARLRPQILPYTHPLINVRDLQLAEVATIELMVSLLLIAITVNIAVLVYARTAMRQGEIAVRTALGATRGRIVGQLFVEALLLSLLGAALGLGAAHLGLQELDAAFAPPEGRAFWIDHGLQPRSVVFALALALISAVVVGVGPGLKSTGHGLNAYLQLYRSGGSLRLGRTWTVLIVAQVAVVVAVLPTALNLGYEEIRQRAVRANFAAQQFVTANLGLAIPLTPGMDGAAYRRETAARFALALPELEQRLEAEPGVAGVTLEGSDGNSPVEIEGMPGAAGSVIREEQTHTGLAPDYFTVLGARLLAGRDFRASDAGALDGGLMVNEAFVRSVLGAGPALGRRVRFVSQPNEAGHRTAAPWREIVGVVEDLYVSPFDREVATTEWGARSLGRRATVYYAVASGQLQAATLLVRVHGADASGFIPRLRQIITIANPDFRVGRVENLALTPNARYLAAVITGLVLALGTVLILSAVGIHALMSLTVTRRRKEIGVRIALGARRSRLLASIFSRAAWQLGLGGLIGSLLGGTLLRINGHTGSEASTFLGGVVVLMMMAGLVAAVGPARRGLRVQPMEALREE